MPIGRYGLPSGYEIPPQRVARSETPDFQRLTRSETPELEEDVHPSELTTSRAVSLPPRRRLPLPVTSHPQDSNNSRTPGPPRSARKPPWRNPARASRPLGSDKSRTPGPPQSSRTPAWQTRPPPEGASHLQISSSFRTPELPRSPRTPAWRTQPPSEGADHPQGSNNSRTLRPPQSPPTPAWGTRLRSEELRHGQLPASPRTSSPLRTVHTPSNRQTRLRLKVKPLQLPVSSGHQPSFKTYTIPVRGPWRSEAPSRRSVLPECPPSPRPASQPPVSSSLGGDRVIHGRIERCGISIKTPGMAPVPPESRLPPKYNEWHPTTVIFEYQHQRRQEITPPLRHLCHYFNGGHGRRSDKIIKEGHYKRVAWLFRYWDDLGIRRMDNYREAPENFWQYAQEDPLTSPTSGQWEGWPGETPDAEDKSKREGIVQEVTDKEVKPQTKDKGKQEVRFAETRPTNVDTELTGKETENVKVIAEVLQEDLMYEDFVIVGKENDSHTRSSKRARVDGERPIVIVGSDTDAQEEGDAKAKNKAINESKVGWEMLFHAFGKPFSRRRD
ncbi:MAG: hypothetical protein Q9218_006496 [Villophora microphyllina]